MSYHLSKETNQEQLWFFVDKNMDSVGDKRDNGKGNSGGCLDLIPYEVTNMTLHDIQASLAHVYHLLRL